MAENAVIESILFFEKCLEDDGIKVERIILFGSQANGQATPESDIDFVVISPDFHKKNIYERAALTMNAEIKTIKKFLLPLDIITMSPMEFESGNSLMSEYARDGKVIYNPVHTEHKKSISRHANF